MKPVTDSVIITYSPWEWKRGSAYWFCWGYSSIKLSCLLRVEICGAGVLRLLGNLDEPIV